MCVCVCVCVCDLGLEGLDLLAEADGLLLLLGALQRRLLRLLGLPHLPIRSIRFGFIWAPSHGIRREGEEGHGIEGKRAGKEQVEKGRGERLDPCASGLDLFCFALLVECLKGHVI